MHQGTLFPVQPIAHTRHRSPVTSVSAAVSVDVTAGQKLVLAALQKLGAKGGIHDKIHATIERLFGPDSISPSGTRSRCKELVDMGLIKFSGHTDDTKSGRKAQIWVLV